MRHIILSLLLSIGTAHAFLSGPGGGGGGGGTWGSITGTLSSQTDLQTALNTKLTKGSKTRFVLDGGDYATLQAAVDAATSGDTLLIGPKATTWGDVTFPAQKRLSIRCLGGTSTQSPELGQMTFSPTTGVIADNEIEIRGCYINKNSASPVITFGGTAPGRFQCYECYINQAGTTGGGVLLSNSGTRSSLYIIRSTINAASGNSTGNMLEVQGRYARLDGTEIARGARAIKITGGTMDCLNCRIEYNQATPATEATGGTIAFGNTLLRNTSTSGDGLLCTSPAVCLLTNVFFDVGNGGSNYCAKGNGFLLYAYLAFNDSALGVGNKKLQNTFNSGAGALPLSTTFTSSP